jgi:hypothetical protein
MWMLTWGDSNPLPDDPVDDSSRVVGTVIRVERDGMMQDIPSGPKFPRRAWILRFAAPRNAGADTVRRRVSLLYRIRANAAVSPLAILGKVLRKLFRRRR